MVGGLSNDGETAHENKKGVVEAQQGRDCLLTLTYNFGSIINITCFIGVEVCLCIETLPE